MGIKRHDAIAPLSRHHHQTLVMTMKLNKLDDAAEPDRVSAIVEELAHYWNNGGEAHFREEEEILLPAFARYAPVNQQPIVDMLLEHVEIRSLVGTIVRGDGDATLNLKKLGVMMEKHVRLEERVVFPLIEAALPEDVLAELKPYFHEHTACKL